MLSENYFARSWCLLPPSVQPLPHSTFQPPEFCNFTGLGIYWCGDVSWSRFSVWLRLFCPVKDCSKSSAVTKNMKAEVQEKQSPIYSNWRWSLFFWPSKSRSLLMALSGLCMQCNRCDLKYPLLFTRSCRTLICCKIDSLSPLFPSENSKYPVHWFLTGTGHPEMLLSLYGCRQWKADWTWP